MSRPVCAAVICTLPMDAGTCAGMAQTKWYFNSVTNQCASFFWSGCGGNPNKFDSEATCLEFCRTSQ